MTTNNDPPKSSPDDDCHFGPANPLGPIDRDAATSNGNTTKTTSTTPIAHHDSLEELEAADGESERDQFGQDDGDQEDDDDSIRSTKLHHTTVWTTVLPSGQAFRTTRTLLLVHAPHQYSKTAGTGKGQKSKKATHRRATATPLSTLYETSTPLGPTHRVIVDYHQPYDGSYTRTTEYIRADGGSTTVKRQEFNRAGVSEGREDVIEYPPMVVGRNSSGGSGGSGSGSPKSSNKKSSASSSSGGNNISATGGVGGGDGTTTISELTYTLAGATTVDDSATIVRDDPTMDPSTVDYNAGYDPRVARKHDKKSPADIFAGRSPHGSPEESRRPTQDGRAKVFHSNEDQQQGNGIAFGPSWSMTENYSQGDPSAAANGPFSFVTVSTSSSSRRRRAKYCKFSYCFALLAVVLGLAAILGGVLSTRNKRGGGESSAAGTDSVGDEDGIDKGEGGGDNDWTPDKDSPISPVSPTKDISDIFANAGYTKSWPSEDGWPIAPSFASFSSTDDDIFEAGNDSYYEAFYLPDAASCAARCTGSDAVGGAYFDLSSQNKRNVCLCFKAAECYDQTLEFSGGYVFVREEHYIPNSQKCLMSSCGYFPDDPLCSGLNIVNVETMLDLELSPGIGLMDDVAMRTFEETCASFLNDKFSQFEDSPVEGVRCRILNQDVSGRERLRRVLQGTNDTLQLNLQVTGLFVPTSRYKTADSVDFDGNVVRYFYRNGDEFLVGLKNDAEASGSDYFEELLTIKRLGAVPKEPSPSPTNKPTRMPVPWPTTDAPSRKPTPKPSPRPTPKPSPRPSKKPSPRKCPGDIDKPFHMFISLHFVLSNKILRMCYFMHVCILFQFPFIRPHQTPNK